MYGKYSLHKFCWIIKVIIGEVRSIMMFHQVDGKKFYNKGLKIVETNLWAGWLGSMARLEENK